MPKIDTGPSDGYQTWSQLNDVMNTANEETCWALLKTELAHKRRQEFIYRIHSRLNKVRAHRERAQLQLVLGGRNTDTLTWLK